MIIYALDARFLYYTITLSLFVLISLRLSFRYDSRGKLFFRSKVGKLEIKDKKKSRNFHFSIAPSGERRRRRRDGNDPRDSTISADNKISFHARFERKSFLIDKHREISTRRNRITLPRIFYRTINSKFNNNSMYTVVGFLVRARPVEEYSMRSSKLVTRARSLLNSLCYSKQERIYIYICLDCLALLFMVAPIFYYPLIDIVPRQDNHVFYNVRKDQLSFFQSLLSLFRIYPFRVNRIFSVLKRHRISVGATFARCVSTVPRMLHDSKFFFLQQVFAQ